MKRLRLLRRALAFLAPFLAWSLSTALYTPAMAEPPTPPSGSRWVPIAELSDEFEGTSLDRSKWQPWHPFWKGAQPGRINPDNVSVADGYLRLKSTTRYARADEIPDIDRDWIDEACVSSVAETAIPGGYYEARIKAQRISSNSAFWLQREFVSEIDIVEAFGAGKTTRPDREFLIQPITHSYRGKHQVDKSNRPPGWHRLDRPVHEWHTYGVWWKDPNNVQFYADGVEVFPAVELPASFTMPMYMLFATLVVKSAGYPDIASLKDDQRNTMLVDWVRSYKLVPD